jgi:signal transduction histidine kinase
VTRYRDQAAAAGLSLEIFTLQQAMPSVWGDRVRLSQALGELIENAIIFTTSSEQDAGRVQIQVDDVEEDGQRWLTIAVMDNGPGISPEEQERVFDRFFRGCLAESGHVPGTGLGLSFAHDILQAHGGRLTVESELGRGSTFTLWLPGASD